MGEFDPGYGAEPFTTLVLEAPGPEGFPSADFRIEWGPVFHRGRSGWVGAGAVGAGSARARGDRPADTGGDGGSFLAQLGITRSYVMADAFLYSVYGQGGGNRHRNDPPIVDYCNRWLDALLGSGWGGGRGGLRGAGG